MDNRRFKTGGFVVAVMIAICAVQAKADEKILYKLKLQKGQKYYIKMTNEQKISQTIMGQEQNMDTTMGMGIDFDVNDVNDNGDAWIDYTYKWVQFRQKTPMGESEYDSSKKDSKVTLEAQNYAALLGEGFTLLITPNGDVKDVKGLEKMRGNIQNKLPEGPIREGAMKGLEQYLSKEAIKEQTESSMAIYPDKTVGIGDSWNKTFVLSYGLTAIVENTWTLKNRENGFATIEIVSNIKPNPQAKPMEIGTAKISHEFSGKQQGLIKMQESTGQLSHSKAEHQLSGQMKIVDTGSPPGGGQEMTIPMKINSITTVEINERKQDTPK